MDALTLARMQAGDEEASIEAGRTAFHDWLNSPLLPSAEDREREELLTAIGLRA